MRQTIALELVNWADQHKKGENGGEAEVLVMEGMSSEESFYEDDDINTSKLTKYSVHRLQWESRRMKKNLKNLIRPITKTSIQELKRESYPGLMGNLLLDAHLPNIFQGGQ